MSASPAQGPLPFTRKDFFDLSIELKTWATELARLDPRRVNLEQCRRFNGWLSRVRRYEPLGTHLVTMRPARPIARWQIVTLVLVASGVVMLALMGRVDRLVLLMLLNGAGLTVLAVYMVPASLFGTTVEGLEGKLLRVVTVLEEMLAANELGFTEGAFFKAREHLDAARLELRQQIDLAHRE